MRIVAGIAAHSALPHQFEGKMAVVTAHIGKDGMGPHQRGGHLQSGVQLGGSFLSQGLLLLFRKSMDVL